MRRHRCRASDPCWAADNCGNVYDCWPHAGGTIALPTTIYDVNTGEIFDFDVELNAAAFVFTTVDSPPCVAPNFDQSCVATDVQSVMTAMTGIGVGLDWVQTAGSTMHPSLPAGDTTKRVIDTGTAAGFCAIYPRGRPATTCDGGSISANDGGSGTDGGTGGDAGSNGGGGNPLACGPGTCAGCCDAVGICQIGLADQACGAAGQRCAACPSGQTCATGRCVPGARPGCGCGSGGAAGLAAWALLFALWRVRCERRR